MLRDRASSQFRHVLVFRHRDFFLCALRGRSEARSWTPPAQQAAFSSPPLPSSPLTYFPAAPQRPLPLPFLCFLCPGFVFVLPFAFFFLYPFTRPFSISSSCCLYQHWHSRHLASTLLPSSLASQFRKPHGRPHSSHLCFLLTPSSLPLLACLPARALSSCIPAFLTSLLIYIFICMLLSRGPPCHAKPSLPPLRTRKHTSGRICT